MNLATEILQMHEVVVEDKEKAKKKHTYASKEIIAVLSVHRTKADIARLTGLSEEQVTTSIAKLLRKGEVSVKEFGGKVTYKKCLPKEGGCLAELRRYCVGRDTLRLSTIYNLGYSKSSIHEAIDTLLKNSELVILEEEPPLYKVVRQTNMDKVYTYLLSKAGEQVHFDGIAKGTGLARSSISELVKRLIESHNHHNVYRVLQKGSKTSKYVMVRKIK